MLHEQDNWHTGFIIFKEDFGKSAQRLLILSIDKGLIHLIAPNNSHRNYIGSKLEYFSLLTFKIGGKNNILQDVEVDSVPLYLKGTNYYSACYLNELIMHLVKQDALTYEEANELFNLYKNTLLTLASDQSTDLTLINLALRKFELRLLHIVGIIYSLELDYQLKPIEPHLSYYFSAEQGFISYQDFKQDTLKLDPILAAEDPIYQQYLEYQIYQQQDISLNSFQGADLLQMYRLFMLDASSSGSNFSIDVSKERELRITNSIEHNKTNHTVNCQDCNSLALSRTSSSNHRYAPQLESQPRNSNWSDIHISKIKTDNFEHNLHYATYINDNCSNFKIINTKLDIFKPTHSPRGISTKITLKYYDSNSNLDSQYIILNNQASLATLILKTTTPIQSQGVCVIHNHKSLNKVDIPSYSISHQEFKEIHCLLHSYKLQTNRCKYNTSKQPELLCKAQQGNFQNAYDFEESGTVLLQSSNKKAKPNNIAKISIESDKELKASINPLYDYQIHTVHPAVNLNDLLELYRCQTVHPINNNLAKLKAYKQNILNSLYHLTQSNSKNQLELNCDNSKDKSLNKTIPQQLITSDITKETTNDLATQLIASTLQISSDEIEKLKQDKQAQIKLHPISSKTDFEQKQCDSLTNSINKLHEHEAYRFINDFTNIEEFRKIPNQLDFIKQVRRLTQLPVKDKVFHSRICLQEYLQLMRLTK